MRNLKDCYIVTKQVKICFHLNLILSTQTNTSLRKASMASCESKTLPISSYLVKKTLSRLQKGN